jgi:hypothetical protein
MLINTAETGKKAKIVNGLKIIYLVSLGVAIGLSYNYIYTVAMQSLK